MMYALIGVGACVALYLWYAQIVVRKNAVDEALGGIDAQLQQRHDLIPNVLAIARRFMTHETELLAEIVRLRNEAMARKGERDYGKLADKMDAERQLDARLGALMVQVENYPMLKSDAPMVEAQRAYQDVENNIAAARRFYNSAVGRLRNASQIFPGGMLASVAGVTAMPPFFETDAPSRTPIAAQSILDAPRAP